jgi:hypothetical protein
VAKDPEKAVALPTLLARRYVRYVVGFGVAVGLGLTPFIGKIPGLDTVSSMIPDTLQGSFIPIAALAMGLVAVVVQFYSGETIQRAAVRRRFNFSLIFLTAGLVIFLVLYAQLVVPVPILNGASTTPIVISFSRTNNCGCKTTDEDIDCIKAASFDPAKIERCWGSRPIRWSKLLLRLSYLTVTVGFGALIGLLLLQEEARRKQKRRPRKAAAPSPPAPAPPQGTS